MEYVPVPFENLIHMHDPKEILIKRNERQRKIFTTDDLESSIPKRGLINPITVNPEDEAFPGKLVLVTGERRLTTYLRLPNLGMIACRYSTELSPIEAQIIELEENLKRQDLSWPEHVEAMLSIHDLYHAEDPSWTRAKTGESLGYDNSTIYRMLELAKAMKDSEDLEEKLGEFNSWGSAYSALENLRARQKEAAEARLHESIASDFAETRSYTVPDVKVVIAESEQRKSLPPDNLAPRIPNPFRNEDFIQWADAYRGVPFNFIHFDPPYGIEIQDSDQTNALEHGTYDDTPEVLWEILGALTRNLHRVMSSSAHMMLWHSPRMGEQIRELFEKNAPDIWLQDVPLVWLKSDNRGVVADVQRRPRNITEFAFFCSRGDRKIIKAVANGYAAPTSRAIHQAEKPIPVLKHFFQMVVDENSRVLDPTSGSGNALVAANEFGAGTILGVEKDKEYHDRSVIAWKKYMQLKLASETVE